MWRVAATACAVVLGAVGCAPALDWREVRIEGATRALLPCKPALYARALDLAGQRVDWALRACKAAGTTWAVGTADVVDPARVGPALGALRASAIANLQAVMESEALTTVPGATPNPSSVRLALRGRLPDGQAVSEELGLFVAGTRIVQATAVGPIVDAQAAEVFFSSLRIVP